VRQFDCVPFVSEDGYFYINGIALMQTPAVYDVFRELVGEFEQIVEIGFAFGGLSLMLQLIKRPETRLVSFDISRDGLAVPPEYGIDFRIGDCFSQETARDIVGLLAAPKRTLVLCDGGRKDSEFATYSMYLKPNDVIMLHDYAESAEDWAAITARIGWTAAPEVTLAAIAPFVEQHGLQRFRYDEMKAILWGSFMKPPS